MKSFGKLLIVIAFFVGIYGIFKPLPQGTNTIGALHRVQASDIHFFEDVTYVDADGTRHSEQEIFDEVFRMIRGAREYILIDMFLYNDFLGSATDSYRGLSGELTDALVAKKKAYPDIEIVFITDPINNIYGGYASPQLKALRDAGVIVVETDLTKLRDSNPLISGFWRAYAQWFGNSTKEGYLPNPFDERGQKLGLRTYLSLMNFKANHRKVVLTDWSDWRGKGFSVLVTSANPHDGSSAHTNVAMRVDSGVWADVLETEKAVAEFSGTDIPLPSEELQENAYTNPGMAEVRLITESKIRDQIIFAVDELGKGDTLDIAMFYLSERKIIGAIKKASIRGVAIRVLLDPNKDAFGREKGGIPNRQVAAELSEHKNIKVRWCDTHGEQCHSKLLIMQNGDITTIIQGSANLTRRNVGNYNLETNLWVKGNVETKAITDAKRYFEKVWSNEGGRIYSTDYDSYRDDAYSKQILYRLMEDLGTSSF